MSKKTLKFDNTHKSIQPLKSHLVNVDEIKHSKDGFKYFIGYKKGEIVKQSCITLL